MSRTVDISTNSDIINFIIFKRKWRQRFYHIFITLVFFFSIFLLYICYTNKNISNAAEKFYNITRYVFEQLFTAKINRVRIHLDKNSLLNDNEIDYIKKKLSNKKISRSDMQNFAKAIVNKNSLIENIYIRKNLSNEELVVFLKEKQIIGIFFDEGCSMVDVNKKCKKNIITINNELLPYHNIKNSDEILKVYGKINTKDIQKIRKIFKKYSLLGKTEYIKFYSSGRFDIILKNGLTIKLPRQNFEKAIQQFNKLDAEYLLSTDAQSIKYIDLRISDKVFFGQSK